MTIWTDDDVLTDLEGYLMRHGNLATPCSRFGRNTAECVAVAVDVIEYIADQIGETPTVDMADHVMGLVVNDHDDIADMLADIAAQNGETQP